MTAPEELARHKRYLARALNAKLLDAMLWGDAAERAAMDARYEPIAQYQKEGPHVGERQEPQSEAGRVN